MRSIGAVTIAAALMSTTVAAQTVGGMSDITVLSVDIGRYEWGSKIIHVYENTRNQSTYGGMPEKWQFVIEPLLSTRVRSRPPGAPPPTLDEYPDVDYRLADLEPIRKVVDKKLRLIPRRRVLIPLDLITEEARDRALDSIVAAYPNIDKCKIGRPNVDVLPLTELTLSVKDIEGPQQLMTHNARIHAKTQSFLTSPHELFLSFDVWETEDSGSRGELDKFLKFIPFMQVEGLVSFSVKSTKFNIASIDIEKLKATALWVNLSGNGGVGFVSRNDLRTLAQNAAVSVRSSFTIEDPASFDQGFVNSLITSSQNVTADEKFFNSQQGKQTYNADDIKPDTVNREINKLFTKETGKDEWHFNSSASTNASVLDLVSGGFSGSLSGSMLKEFLHERNIESDIQGDKIIAKSIQIKQVNLSNFVSSYNYGTEYRNVSGSKQNLKTVIFGAPVKQEKKARFSGLASTCSNIQNLTIQ